jgi:hypothetical protein
VKAQFRGPSSDPFLQWLRYRGYFRVACVAPPAAPLDPVRLLCPVSADVPLDALVVVAAALRRELPVSGAEDLGAWAAARLASLLIRHSEEFHPPWVEPVLGLTLRGRTPADLVSAVLVADYPARPAPVAPVLATSIPLPSWSPIHSPSI